MVLVVLINTLAQRVREIREFILLPWSEKKNKIRGFWMKYGRLYIILFTLTTVIAFINVYIETCYRAKKSHSQRTLIGGGQENNKLNTESSSSNSDAKNDSPTKPLSNGTQTANTKSVDTKPENKNSKSGNNEKPSTTNNTTELVDNNKQQKKSITISTSVITSTAAPNKTSKVDEIRERRKAKAEERASKTSIQESLSSLGNNLTAGISSGTGKALSVLGTFFSAILGLLLFCCAPVVIFYLWMKKLIMPLFPTSRLD